MIAPGQCIKDDPFPISGGQAGHLEEMASELRNGNASERAIGYEDLGSH